MDWNDLRYFLAVQRAGSLAGAARLLKVEHSTVSRRLAALEEALGARLYTRGSDGLVPTAAAVALRPLAEEVERAAEAVTRNISGDSGRPEGVVRLTTSEAFSGLIVKGLGELRARHPALTVEILSGNQAFDIGRGEADLALRIMNKKDPDLIMRKVCEAGWSLYASESYLTRAGLPRREDGLAGHQVVAFDETLAQVPGALWLAAHAKRAEVGFRANSLVSALNAVVIGMGVSVLPCFLAEVEPQLRRLTPEVLASRDVWLVVHPDLARVARVRAVMDFLLEILGRELPRITGRPANPGRGTGPGPATPPA